MLSLLFTFQDNQVKNQTQNVTDWQWNRSTKKCSRATEIFTFVLLHISPALFIFLFILLEQRLVVATCPMVEMVEGSQVVVKQNWNIFAPCAAAGPVKLPTKASPKECDFLSAWGGLVVSSNSLACVTRTLHTTPDSTTPRHIDTNSPDQDFPQKMGFWLCAVECDGKPTLDLKLF